MVDILTEEQVNEILSSSKFQEDYLSYEKNIDVEKLSNFFDDIETNRNYFRLNIKKSRKYCNKNNDTLTIKNINSNINKCTDDNYDNIIKLIITDITKNKHLINLILESLLEKSIIHHTYVNIYVKILNEINKYINVNRVLNNLLNKYSDMIFNHNNETSDNKYEDLCNINKQTDNMIGYLMLITYLDKYGIITNRINNLLEIIMGNILDKDNDEIFKLLNCIYNICLISVDYIMGYKEKIMLLKDKKYNSKVRCKVMDIEDLF